MGSNEGDGGVAPMAGSKADSTGGPVQQVAHLPRLPLMATWMRPLSRLDSLSMSAGIISLQNREKLDRHERIKIENDSTHHRE